MPRTRNTMLIASVIRDVGDTEVCGWRFDCPTFFCRDFPSGVCKIELSPFSLPCAVTESPVDGCAWEPELSALFSVGGVCPEVLPLLCKFCMLLSGRVIPPPIEFLIEPIALIWMLPASISVSLFCVSVVEPIVPSSCPLILFARSRQNSLRVAVPASNSS